MPTSTTTPTDGALQTRIDGLVYAYRTLGHTIASTNPLAKQRLENELLSLRELGFAEKDLELAVSSKYFLGGATMPLREMRAKLEEIYCGRIGFEFMHIAHPRVRNWVRDRIENRSQWSVDAATKKRMLRHILKVESFERFLHQVAYKGQKRFSCEGAEALISALDGVLENCPRFGVEEVTIHASNAAIVSSGRRLSGGIFRSSSVCRIALSSKLSAGLFGTITGDVSPPLSNASRESTRKLPLSLSPPWHLKQTSTSTGRTFDGKEICKPHPNQCRPPLEIPLA